jgi:hypothetical protein
MRIDRHLLSARHHERLEIKSEWHPILETHRFGNCLDFGYGMVIVASTLPISISGGLPILKADILRVSFTTNNLSFVIGHEV